MDEYLLSISENPKKKYDVLSPEGKIIRFGASNYEDYTIHKNLIRKDAYISRHHKEDWTNLNKAGSWSRWLLWNKPSIRGSIRDMERKFGIKISLV